MFPQIIVYNEEYQTNTLRVICSLKGRPKANTLVRAILFEEYYYSKRPHQGIDQRVAKG